MGKNYCSNSLRKICNNSVDRIKIYSFKEAIDKAKDTTIDLAEKAVQALKDWLKPEDK